MEEQECDKKAATPLRILIVDSEQTIVELLRVALAHEGFQVDVATDGPAAFDCMRETSFALVILDVMLPGLDGFEICKRIRASSDIPILMLTAREQVQDRVMGLNLGADDYVIRPVGFSELVARIRALLRRRDKSMPQNVLYAADLTLDREARTVERAGHRIPLTAKEFELLELFMSHPGQVFRRQILLNRVWGRGFAGDANLVDVHVRHLRDKLGDRPPRLLRTVHGVRYVWREKS